MAQKKDARTYRKERIRKKIFGTANRPRLCVFRSEKHLYAQIVDDVDGKTLLGTSTKSKDFSAVKDSGNVKGAQALGKLVAQKALQSNIKEVVFDRGGFLYHGRIKAFADAAREGGLKF